MSPTLNRSICLGQLDAHLATPGTQVTVPATRRQADTPPALRRSLLTSIPRAAACGTGRTPPGGPAHTVRNARSLAARVITSRPDADSELGVTLPTPVRSPGGRPSPRQRGRRDALGPVRTGRPRRPRYLVVGSGPGEWLVLAEPGTQDELRTRLEALASCGEFVTVVDVTHGRALCG